MDRFYNYSSVWLVSVVILALGPFTRLGKAAFYLMLIVALIYVFTNIKELRIDNNKIKYFFWALSVWFAWTVFSNFANGMPEYSVRSLWRREAYIMAIIPLYFFLKAYPVNKKLLLYMVLISGLIMFGRGLYDILHLDLPRMSGGEHPIQYASIAMLMFIVLMVLLFNRLKPVHFYLLLIIAIVLLLVIGMTLARGVWLTLPVIVVFAFWYYRQRIPRVFKVASIVSFFVLLGMMYQLPAVQERYQLTATNIERYFDHIDEVDHWSKSTSLGTRLEMWRAAWNIFSDNPIIGVGLGGYEQAARLSQDKYHYNDSAYTHYHPHNQYLSELVNKGFPGLILFVLMLVLLYRSKHSSVDVNDPYAVIIKLAVLSVSVLCVTNATFEAKSMVLAMSMFIAIILSFESVKE